MANQACLSPTGSESPYALDYLTNTGMMIAMIALRGHVSRRTKLSSRNTSHRNKSTLNHPCPNPKHLQMESFLSTTLAQARSGSAPGKFVPKLPWVWRSRGIGHCVNSLYCLDGQACGGFRVLKGRWCRGDEALSRYMQSCRTGLKHGCVRERNKLRKPKNATPQTLGAGCL